LALKGLKNTKKKTEFTLGIRHLKTKKNNDYTYYYYILDENKNPRKT
jgi:hypothetical protein